MPVPSPSEKQKTQWIREKTPWSEGVKWLEEIWLLGTLIRLLAGRKITIDSYHDTKKDLGL